MEPLLMSTLLVMSFVNAPLPLVFPILLPDLDPFGDLAKTW